MDKLVELYRGLIDQTETTYMRYLRNKADWSNKLTAIIGARETGKATLLLQHLKLHHYFCRNTLGKCRWLLFRR